MATSRLVPEVVIMMPADDEAKKGDAGRSVSPATSEPEIVAAQRTLLSDFEEYDGAVASRAATVADVGRMLDAVSDNASRFSFKQGFYSESEADLARYHRGSHSDVEGYHRKEDFPHMRHLLALETGAGVGGAGAEGVAKKRRPRSSSRSRSSRSRSPASKQAFSSPQSSKSDVISMSNAKSVPDVLPSSKAWERDPSGSPPSTVASSPPQAQGGKGSPSVVLALGTSPPSGADGTDGKKSSSQGASLLPRMLPVSMCYSEDIDEVTFYVGGDCASMESVPPTPRSPQVREGRGRVKFCVGSISSLDEGSPVPSSGARHPTTPPPRPPPPAQLSNAPPGGRVSSTVSGGSGSGSGRSRRHKHVPSAADLARRRHPGSAASAPTPKHKQLVVFEDDVKLNEVDLVELSNHRFDKTIGSSTSKKKRWSNAMANIVQIGNKTEPRPSVVGAAAAAARKAHWANIDHSPHDLFIELDELYMGEGEDGAEWREKSRWIKFEEDVEEGAERWGKPHVASLSFHSLLELRRVIEHGHIILDLEADGLPNIAEHIVTELVDHKVINLEQSAALLKALLLKHRHVNEKSTKMRRNFSYSNLQGLDSSSTANPSRKSTDSHIAKALSTGGLMSWFSKKTSSSATFSKKPEEKNGLVDLPNVASEAADTVGGMAAAAAAAAGGPGTSPETIRSVPTRPSLVSHKRPSAILSRIPIGAEATNVLVGAVDFLDKPVMAFVRLARGQQLDEMTEVPLPVRFLFLLVGPMGMDYHEVGRSISTLMSNTHFHEMAYQAMGREDLLSAINEFLDDSVVLPPGEWHRNTLLPIVALAKEKAMRKKAAKLDKEKEALLAAPDGGDGVRRVTSKGGDEDGDDDNPLRRTGRPFGGLVRDIKRRYPHYLSDLTDALNLQCLSTIIFIYFACLSPAITFGGLLGDKTERWMGVSEVLLITSVCGAIFAVFSGQPLNIMGVTGPILVFEEALYQICKKLEWNFLEFHAMVGVWVAVITLVMVAVDGSYLVRAVSRFTEEIFASLISLIFIYEVFSKLYKIFKRHPLMESYIPEGYVSLLDFYEDGNFTNFNGTVRALFDHLSVPANSTEEIDPSKVVPYAQPNTALLSVILTVGTFTIAFSMKRFRNSKFLGRHVRRALGDFGIPLAIVVMVTLDYLIKDTYTEKLSVPDGLKPTDETLRSWFVNPMGGENPLPVWTWAAAIIPAFLVFILVFMESQITSIIVNKKERKLKKGPGYHLDLLLIGCVFPLASSFVGLPFLCAATVRSVAHVSALTNFSRTHAPGDKPKLLGVKEQRVTNFAVHVLIGVSVLMGPLLRLIPVAVLFGVFLYMGIASMAGIQLFERIELMFMPVKHHPDVAYVRRVKRWRMILFTGIQIVALGLLWYIKSTVAALAFPFVLILLVPFRHYALGRIFTEQELQALDTAEDGDELTQIQNKLGDEDELDFYEQAHMPM